MTIPRPSGPWRCAPVHMAEYCAQLERFARLHGNDMARLNQHLADGEHDLAHGIAHNIKCIAQLIGARRIALLAAELMRSLRPGADTAGIAALAEACELEFARLAEVTRMKPAAATKPEATSPAALS